MATLKGIFPNPKPTRRKNFIQENVKNLRRMEQFFHSKEVEDLQKLQLQKKSLDKYQNVASRINSSLRNSKNEDVKKKSDLRRSETNLYDDDLRPERKISDPIPGKNTTNDRKCRGVPGKTDSVAKSKTTAKSSRVRDNRATKVCSNPNLLEEDADAGAACENNFVKYRNQGIQTMGTDDMGILYREGVIRYPSSRGSKKNDSPTQNTDGMSPGRCVPSDRGDISPTSPRRHSFELSNSPPASGDQPDHGKWSKQKATVAGKMAMQLNNGVPPPSYRKGVVPKYIRDRKEAQHQRDEKIKAATSHSDCPEGHVPLPDDERKETLRMLKKHYQEYVNELNMMPIKTDTLRSQRRKMEIEKQLIKLEEGIKVFSRPKVYVKVNA